MWTTIVAYGHKMKILSPSISRIIPRGWYGCSVLVAGVGTTLVQSCLHGFNVVGFEINPYAALASRMKLESATVSIREFERHIAAFRRFMQDRCPDDAKPKVHPRC
jgi:hypothetical protein